MLGFFLRMAKIRKRTLNVELRKFERLHYPPFLMLDCITYFAPMIAYLKGSFTTKTPSLVYIDVNGVGYEVQISLNTYSKIQDLDSGILLTHLLVREDAHILFGFFELAE